MTEAPQSAKSSPAGWIVHHPWKVIGSTLILLAIVGYFLQFVRPSITFQDLLGKDWPGLKDYEFLQTEYIADDNLLVLVEARDGDAFTQRILTGVRDLTGELWKTPHSIRVDSVTNFQHTEADGDDLAVGDLVNAPEHLDQAALQRVKKIALDDPIALHRVVNPEGNVLALNVTFHFPMLSGDEKLNSYGYVRELADRFGKDHPETRVYVGGLTALDATVMTISMEETGLFLGLVMLVAVALLALMLRAIVPVFASALVLVFSIMAGMSLAGMMGWKLTPFTTTVPMIILIIGVADCVHLVTAFVQRNGREPKNRALTAALAANFKPILITSVTTAIGFLTLNFSGSLSIAALGNQAAFGVMFACLLSVTFLPAMLAILPMKVQAKREPQTERYTRLADWLHRNRRAVLVASALVAVALGLQVPRNVFDDRIPTYFAESLPWRQANDFSENQFGSAYNFTYSLDAGHEGAVSDPEYLKKVERFAEYLRGLPEAAYVKSVTDTFKRLNRNMHGDDPAFYRLPEDRETAAQYLLLYEMSLPYGLDLNDQINMDKSATKVLAAFKSMSVTEVLAMDAKVNRWIDSNLPEMSYVSSGVQIMFAHLMSQDTRGLTLGAIYGLVIISALLVFMLRSLKIGLLSMLPNLLPALLAFGIWGLTVGQVGFGIAMVSGMSIGIIVDDTVHFLTKYLRARREEGLDAKEAVAYTFEHVGPSIVFTTVVLVAGFLLMVSISEFRVNTDMGKMTSIILGFALLFDLVTLPVLLMIFDGEPVAKPNLDTQTMKELEI
ncbi:MMPL family transporter [Sulfidibacter corallicola]|uniref:MMPL family transporter n=1 Tax=Sulfidibacter corallicola TaxID=2818388 RepID=A0A8A4TV17_SULCO|nr:MMPL family transporter [Sulfidibacter corallicola]QTD53806.1 MMPL family transporter [Sulfidibacter corallicola]